MYTKNAEFKAGIIVLMGIAALLALVWFAGGAEPVWGEWRYIHVRFKQGYVAPKVGDRVLMNGAPVGRVSQVMQREEIRGAGGSAPLTALDRLRLGVGPGDAGTVREFYVLAEIKMPADQIVPVGTTAQIEKSVTGIRQLSLLPGVSQENLTDEQTHATPLPGEEAPGLSDISSRISGLAQKLETLASQGGEVMMEAKALLVTLREKVDAVDTAEMDKDARAAVAALRRTLEEFEGRVGSIGGNMEDASKDIKTLAQKAVATLDRIDGDVAEALGSLKKAMNTLDGILVEAKGPVRQVLGDLKIAAKNAADVTGELAGVGPEARQLIAGLGVDIDTLLRNLIDTSRNLQDTSEDVRAHPWKLLNKPENEEIAFENLRAAALNYMRAMRDLNDTSRSLVALLGRTDLDLPEVKARVDQAVAEFKAAQDRYQRDEARWQELFRQAGTARRGR